MHITFPNGWDSMWKLSDEDEQHAITTLFQLLDEFAAEQEGSNETSRDPVC